MYFLLSSIKTSVKYFHFYLSIELMQLLVDERIKTSPNIYHMLTVFTMK